MAVTVCALTLHTRGPEVGGLGGSGRVVRGRGPCTAQQAVPVVWGIVQEVLFQGMK